MLNGCAFKWCITFNKLNMLKCLFEKGANIHFDDDMILREASKCGNIGIVEYLIEKGANVHVNNNEPIRDASKNGHLNVVKCLVKHGANIHAQNEYPLRLASENGHLSIVRYLVNLGADIHAKNSDAIYFAAANKHMHIVKYLLLIGSYYQHIQVNFKFILNLYSCRCFKLIQKLICNENCNIVYNELEQFGVIRKHVNEIIEWYNWNKKIYNNANFVDTIFQFSL